MRNTLIGQENILSFCKKMFFTAVLIQLMNISSFAQNKDVDVNIVFEKTIKHVECRYCQANASQTFLTKVYFEDDKYKGTYDFFLRKLEAANLAGNFLKSSELPKVCDMSRTGNHGVESYNEKIVETQSFSFSRLVEALEEKKKEEEQQRKEAEQQELKKREQERVLKLNKAIFVLYDSIEYCYKKIAESGDKILFDKMKDYNKRIWPLFMDRDNASTYFLLKPYQVNIPYDKYGYGGRDLSFSYAEIYYDLCWAQLWIYDFAGLIDYIERVQRDEVFKVVNNKVTSEIKAWAYLGLGNIDAAYNEFFNYIEGSEYMQNALKRIYQVLSGQSNMFWGHSRMNSEEKFSCKNRVLLLKRLMRIKTSNGGFLYCIGESGYSDFEGELSALDVGEVLNIPEKQVKKLVKHGYLKFNQTTKMVYASSVLKYLFDSFSAEKK
ncbi:MAG: hypothetical protein RLY35_1535 [Bacteroidota bacterium]|jgi:hypothetical protein